jgi:hypothetical protein
MGTLGFVLAVVLVSSASAHSNPCHSQHTCPSDHHTYMWTDPTTGLQWDCVEPGAPEYNPILDVTTIVWDGRTYYLPCGRRCDDYDHHQHNDGDDVDNFANHRDGVDKHSDHRDHNDDDDVSRRLADQEHHSGRA